MNEPAELAKQVRAIASDVAEVRGAAGPFAETLGIDRLITAIDLLAQAVQSLATRIDEEPA